MKIYRYQPINKQTISNLLKEKNWVANPFDFNDPFEFRMPEIYYYNSKGENKKIVQENAKARVLYKKTLDQFGVVCYSSIEPNPLMWAHYADSHKGFCLEFEVAEENIKSLRNVNYKDQLDKLEFTLDEQKLKDEIVKICTTKATAWEYENEFRQIFTSKHFLAGYPGKLTGIIFGCRAKLDDIELVLNSVNVQLNTVSISKNFIQQNTFLLGKSILTFKKDGTYEIPKFWEKLLEI